MKIIIIFFLFTTNILAQTDSLDCKDIVYRFDKFKNKKSWHSEFYKEIRVKKYIDGKVISNYLCFYAESSSLLSEPKGLFLIFDDNTNYKIPNAKIDVDAGSDGFVYSYWLRLTSDNILKFKTKKVVAFKLYVFDKDLDLMQSNDINRWINCLINLKIK